MIVCCCQDAVKYYKLLLKQVGVDCHATFINTGKFLTIEGKMLETEQSEACETSKAKHFLKERADSRKINHVQDTLDRATQAGEQLKIANTSYKNAQVMVAKNKEARRILKVKVDDVFAFLFNTTWTSFPSAICDTITVKNLPDLATFANVQSVSQFREYRKAFNNLLVSDPQAAARLQSLDKLEDYEFYFDIEFVKVGHLANFGLLYIFLDHLLLHILISHFDK